MPNAAVLRRLKAAVLTVALSACSGDEPRAPSAALTTGALPAQQATQQALAAGQAQLALSRVGGVLYAGAPATIKVNGQQVAELWAGNSSSVVVPAGPIRISVEAWSYPGAWALDLTAQEGQVYAIEIAPREDSVLAGSLLGPIGGLIDQGSNGDKSGAFQLRVVSNAPQRS